MSGYDQTTDEKRREVRDIELKHPAYNTACSRFRYTCIALDDAQKARDEARRECERLEKEIGL